ncbi:MAG: hypothetical protein J5993_04505 [Clostridia bacterium]|nr:hypothetical protein [Clostridia bacterium]
MKITYLGTAAAEGIPAVFCNCATCKEARKRGGRELRTRSQVLIDDSFCVDYPPEAYMHSVRFGVDLSAIEYLLVTHSHMDHFYAHDFILRGYKYAHDMTRPNLTICGNEEVKKVFEECTRREMREVVLQTIGFRELREYCPVLLGEYKVTPLPARHSVWENCFVYLIEKEGKKVLYLNDTGRLGAGVYEHLRYEKVDLVSFDCTFVGETVGEARHMGIGDCMAVKAELEKVQAVRPDTKYVVTHFSHNQAPLQETLEKIEKEYGVIAAYDGMSLEL